MQQLASQLSTARTRFMSRHDWSAIGEEAGFPRRGRRHSGHGGWRRSRHVDHPRLTHRASPLWCRGSRRSPAPSHFEQLC